MLQLQRLVLLISLELVGLFRRIHFLLVLNLSAVANETIGGDLLALVEFKSVLRHPEALVAFYGGSPDVVFVVVYRELYFLHLVRRAAPLRVSSLHLVAEGVLNFLVRKVRADIAWMLPILSLEFQVSALNLFGYFWIRNKCLSAILISVYLSNASLARTARSLPCVWSEFLRPHCGTKGAALILLPRIV